ncbi:MAG: hypothetical protein ACLP1X_05825 [Polyangiaceae bacterium]
MRRTALLGAVVALGACGTSATPTRSPPGAPPPSNPSATTESAAAPKAPAPPPSPATRESRLIARMLPRVVAARGLEAKRPVPGVLLDRAALIAQVKDHVSRELPPEAIRNEGLSLQLFGFVPTEFDYEAAQYRLLEDQLAGFYEPSDGTMYMASDLGDQEAEATLAHELVHALQDERWNLESRSRYVAGDGDRSEAVSALAEGDATSAMFDVLIANSPLGGTKSALDVPDEVFADQIRGGMDEGPGGGAPHVMRTSLAAPYIYGTLFVHALRRRGGWGAVDGAWDKPPTTTEQILHVEKWLAHEPPLSVAAPPFATLGAGWKVADEDSEGELGTRLAFEEWTDPAAAASVSSDWGGDRGVLVTNGDRAAYAWRLRYDPAASGDSRTARALRTIKRGAMGPAKATDDSFVCRERGDRGPIAIARSGSDLVFVFGPAHLTPGKWTSAGDCALARKWTREIAAARP